MLKIGHEVIRPSKLMGGEDVTIPVPEELETVPGIRQTKERLIGTVESIL